MRRKLFSSHPLLPLDVPGLRAFPQTRYQGSKLKIVDWIWQSLSDLKFETVLDVFGGTGAVSYALKSYGKSVVYNDILRFNYLIGLALIENSHAVLSNGDIDWLLDEHEDTKYPNFISNTFNDVYFLDDENRWLDVVATNIRNLPDKYKQALAYFALFQSCIVKRPFNLFHRRNLYIRTSNVPRTFGNKTTWDTPFEVHFRNFVMQANAAVFDSGRTCRALNCDVFAVPGEYDLVYVDSPYISPRGVGVDYLGFYHFLEGLSDYDAWPNSIDWTSKHRRIRGPRNDWVDKNRIRTAFERLFQKYRRSILVVSYRSPGIPSEQEIAALLRNHKGSVCRLNRKEHQYVLSPDEGEELLFVAI